LFQQTFDRCKNITIWGNKDKPGFFLLTISSI
jgi:hypothetical protein